MGRNILREDWAIDNKLVFTDDRRITILIIIAIDTGSSVLVPAWVCTAIDITGSDQPSIDALDIFPDVDIAVSEDNYLRNIVNTRDGLILQGDIAVNSQVATRVYDMTVSKVFPAGANVARIVGSIITTKVAPKASHDGRARSDLRIA